MRRKKLEGSGYEIDHWAVTLGKQNAPLAKMQLCEYKYQTVEAFVAATEPFVLLPPCGTKLSKAMFFNYSLEHFILSQTMTPVPS